MTKATYFASPPRFRAWLAENHARAPELLVGFHKVDSGKPSISWPESVDEALCFGWIDGVRRRIDDHAYTIRFTPRRPGSVWSAVNLRRVAALEAAGRMRPAGRAAFEARATERARTYSYERTAEPELEAALAKEFEAAKKAWAFFWKQPPSYRRRVLHWIVSAKGAEVRRRRLRRVIGLCASGRRA
jgi:uncharacterized protein YdeI (YjbR/CyaY-like superfamily)